MSGRFNPSDPLRVGLEWLATDDTSDPIDFAAELGTRVVPTSTRVLENLRFFSPGPPLGADYFNSWILATVYEEGSEANFGFINTTSAVVTGGSTTGSLVNAATIAEALESFGDDKSVQLDAAEELRCRFTLPVFETPNPRILNVEFVVGLVSAAGTNSLTMGYRLSSGVFITGAIMNVLGANGGNIYEWDTGEIYLAGYDYVTTPTDYRRRVWFISDLVDLAAGTVEFRLLNNGAVTYNINYVGMQVTYCEENRIASGGMIHARTTNMPWAPGWQPDIDVIDIATENLGTTLIQGREYLVTLTRASDSQLSVQNLPGTSRLHYQEGAARELAALRPIEGQVDVNGYTFPRLTSGVLAGPVTSTNRGYALLGSDDNDLAIDFISQPYAQVRSEVITPPATQTVSSITGGDYSHVSFLVRRFGAPAPLVITVGGSTATLTDADYDDLTPNEDGFVYVTIPFDAPATLAANTPTTIDAAVGSGANRWVIPVLSTTDADSLYTGVTYGGATLTGQSDARLDYTISLTMPVPVVTGFDVGHGDLPLSPMVTGCPQPVSQFVSLDYANLAWDPIPVVTGAPPVTGSPFVTGFCAWEVERRDTVDPDWRPIGRINDIGVRTIADYEGRIGVETDYRVRLCRLDGVCGDWAVVTGFVRVGPTSVNGQCDGLVFTSNEDPDATVAYPIVFNGTVTEDFTFVEAETVVLQRLHMRDYQVAFRPLERGGVRFQRTLLVNALVAPANRLDKAFAGLRDLAWESLSYVAVLDTRGARWLAAVIVPAVTIRSPLEVYLASVDIVEVTDRPTVVNVESTL